MSEDPAKYTIAPHHADQETAAYMAGFKAGKADRNWIKLTDLEISNARYANKTDFLFAREIERILREKNLGQT